jgi:raffinose/stachyose/melibiose transport system permease protein
MRDSKTVMGIKYFILTSLCVAMMLPVLVAILGSIRTTGEFMTRPFGLPTHGIQWENYTRILLPLPTFDFFVQDGDKLQWVQMSGSPFWRSGVNSFLITIGVVALNVTFASLLAFVFSRIQFRTRNLWFNILSIGLLFPLVVAILPIFIQIRRFGLTGNLLGVILPMAAFGIPGSVVILRGFFVAVPKELEEAAYIDGATIHDFFIRILIPIVRPAIFAVATIQIIAAWNEFFLPLVVLTGNPNAWPLPLGLMQFQGQYGTDWAAVMAYISILMIPAIVFYLFTQKYIVTGLTGGELKG